MYKRQVPVEFETFENEDQPFYPMQNNATYKEVWVHTTLSLIHIFSGAACLIYDHFFSYETMWIAVVVFLALLALCFFAYCKYEHWLATVSYTHLKGEAARKEIGRDGVRVS